jgi:G3E family GTPase
LTPITIVTGFLGAGKTTLLRRMLTNPGGRRLGVLVNDFGALNVDAELLAEIKSDIVSLKNGCICCTINDDLVGGVTRLIDSEDKPDHIVVETSGVSDPRRVAEAFFAPSLRGRLKIDGVFCLVDCLNFPDLNHVETELAIDQAAVADIAILNKTDLVSEATVESIAETLHDALPAMRLHRTVQSEIPLDVILGGDRLDRTVDLSPLPKHGHHHHDHHHDDHSHEQVFTSCAWSSDRPICLETFRKCIAQLPRGVYRAKGILAFKDAPGERGHFHLVGKRSTLDLVSAATPDCRSALIAIGPQGSFQPDELTSLLDRSIISTSS